MIIPGQSDLAFVELDLCYSFNDVLALLQMLTLRTKHGDIRIQMSRDGKTFKNSPQEQGCFKQ